MRPTCRLEKTELKFEPVFCYGNVVCLSGSLAFSVQQVSFVLRRMQLVASHGVTVSALCVSDVTLITLQHGCHRAYM